MKKTALILITLVFIGCSSKSTKPLYYWGDYQSEQISYSKKIGDKDALLSYKKTLENIIEKNKVAPSVYSEYALVLVKLGEKDKAREYFLKEIKTYPESQIFIENVMKKIYGENQWKSIFYH